LIESILLGNPVSDCSVSILSEFKFVKFVSFTVEFKLAKSVLSVSELNNSIIIVINSISVSEQSQS